MANEGIGSLLGLPGSVAEDVCGRFRSPLGLQGSVAQKGTMRGSQTVRSEGKPYRKNAEICISLATFLPFFVIENIKVQDYFLCTCCQLLSHITVSPSFRNDGATSTTRGARNLRTASFRAEPRL